MANVRGNIPTGLWILNSALINVDPDMDPEPAFFLLRIRIQFQFQGFDDQ